MESISFTNALSDVSNALSDVWSHFGWRDALDVAILSLVFFRIYLWIRGTVAVHVGVGLALVGAGAIAASRAELLLTTYLLQLMSALGILMIFFLFRMEIRRALLHASPLRWVSRRFRAKAQADDGQRLTALAEGLVRLAERRIGALVVIPRVDDIEDHLTGGRPIEAAIDPALLEAIFHTHSPLHDGALVVQDGWTQRAGAVLPLASGEELEEEHGTRHRAAVGLSERCDALVLVVSEERGRVGLALQGALHETPTDPTELKARIAEALDRPGGARGRARRGAPSRGHVLRRLGRAALALVIICASVFAAWAVLLGDRSAVRTRPVELNLRGVPAELDVEVRRPRDQRIRVRVRGPERLVTLEALGQITAWVRIDEDTKPGFRRARVRVRAPAGLRVEAFRPQEVLLLIRRVKKPRK